jgi:hypothetical protein
MIIIKHLRVLIIAFVFALFISQSALAAQANFSWLPNNESDGTAGYMIYYGTSSRVYTESVDVGSPDPVGGRICASVFQLAPEQKYFFAVVAYNAEGDESSYSTEIAYEVVGDTATSNPDEMYALDNGDTGTSHTGIWSVSGGPNPYGADSLWAKKAGAQYSYDLGVTGLSEISLWWTTTSSRCTSVPVQIYDGNTLIDTAYVNQQNNSGVWNTIGEYNFSNNARVVIRSESSSCSTSADAVGFTATTSSPGGSDGSDGSD